MTRIGAIQSNGVNMIPCTAVVRYGIYVYVFENTILSEHCKSILGLHYKFPNLVIDLDEIKCYLGGGHFTLHGGGHFTLHGGGQFALVRGDIVH